MWIWKTYLALSLEAQKWKADTSPSSWCPWYFAVCSSRKHWHGHFTEPQELWGRSFSDSFSCNSSVEHSFFALHSFNALHAILDNSTFKIVQYVHKSFGLCTKQDVYVFNIRLTGWSWILVCRHDKQCHWLILQVKWSHF